MGLEPTTSRATTWRSNQLSYTHHMARLKGFEPLTHGLEGRCSIQLSYRCKFSLFTEAKKFNLERVMGIGPTLPAWKAGILPLNYTRISVPKTTLIDFIKIKNGCQLFVKPFFKFFKNLSKNLIFFINKK